MIRTLLAACLLLWATLASAQEVLAPNPDIEATIQSQFDAFLDRDVGEAWTYASPNIQSLFGSPENFGRMVATGYPMVWTPGRVAFIDLQTLGGRLVQRVEVIDQAGTAHYLGYQMIETDAGWRINGVQILRAPGVGA
jgi:hypothetical protein